MTWARPNWFIGQSLSLWRQRGHVELARNLFAQCAIPGGDYASYVVLGVFALWRTWILLFLKILGPHKWMTYSYTWSRWFGGAPFFEKSPCWESQSGGQTHWICVMFCWRLCDHDVYPCMSEKSWLLQDSHYSHSNHGYNHDQPLVTIKIYRTISAAEYQLLIAGSPINQINTLRPGFHVTKFQGCFWKATTRCRKNWMVGSPSL